MKKIENIRWQTYDKDGVTLAVLDGQVSETSDLPTLGGDFCGAKVLPGCGTHVTLRMVRLPCQVQP